MAQIVDSQTGEEPISITDSENHQPRLQNDPRNHRVFPFSRVICQFVIGKYSSGDNVSSHVSPMIPPPPEIGARGYFRNVRFCKIVFFIILINLHPAKSTHPADQRIGMAQDRPSRWEFASTEVAPELEVISCHFCQTSSLNRPAGAIGNPEKSRSSRCQPGCAV